VPCPASIECLNEICFGGENARRSSETSVMNEKKYRVTLTEEERSELEAMISKGKAAARTLTRARILLKADASEIGPAWSDEQVRSALDVGLATVYRLRQAFVELGLEAALRPRKANRKYARILDGDQEAHLIALACGKPPAGFARWTLRLLAERFVDLRHAEHVCPETVRQTLKKTC
jgi:transposase